MIATTYDDIFNTALELTPLGHLSKSTRLGRFTKSAMSGAALGPVGTVLKPTMDASMRIIAKSPLGKAMSKRVDGLVQFAKAVPEKVLGKKAAGRLASITGKNSIPHRVLGDLGYARYAAIKEVGKEVGKRAAASAISEGIEEGKQYLNAQRYISGEYDNEEYGIWNLRRFQQDFEAMSKSALVMAGFPLFMSFTDDAELIANIKGGMKGGFMQTGATMTAQSIPGLVSQTRLNDELYKNALLQKASERDFWEKGILFAKKATSGGNLASVERAVEHIKAGINNRSRSQEDIDAANVLLDQQLEMAKEIFKTANSKLAKDAAKANGIEYNTERYHQFVSLLSLVNQQG